MSTNLVRLRNAAVAVKIEAASGTDAIAGTPANADWIGADCVVRFDQIEESSAPAGEFSASFEALAMTPAASPYAP